MVPLSETTFAAPMGGSYEPVFESRRAMAVIN